MNRALVPLKDSYVKPVVAEIGDAFFVDAPILTASGSMFDSRQYGLSFYAVGEDFYWEKGREDGISTPYSGSARISISSNDTSMASTPSRVKWQLKLLDGDNKYTVAHGIIVLTRPLRST